MAFSRNNYDSNAYNLQIKRSTDPLEYRLFGSFAENINSCLAPECSIGSKADVSLVREQTHLTNEEMTNVENALSWRSKILSKENTNTDPFSKFKLINKKQCSNKLSPEDTRFSYPLDNYRCMSVLEFELTPYLPVNPQCFIQSIDEKIGLNSRLFSKDNYKIPKQEFWDKELSLPKDMRLN
jgi:hypothetical protein